MPWSTWTTWSPTFRSRKSERNARAAERRRSDGRRSSSKTSVSAKICSAACGRRNPRDRMPVATSTAAACAISPRACHAVALVRVDEDGDGDQLVVAQHLDGALGPARAWPRRTARSPRPGAPRLISSTQSATRPRNSTAGWQAIGLDGGRPAGCGLRSGRARTGPWRRLEAGDGAGNCRRSDRISSSSRCVAASMHRPRRSVQREEEVRRRRRRSSRGA